MDVFYEKVADRIGKLDAEGLKRQYKALTDEIGFFESIFNSLDEGIIALDTKGRVKYANAVGQELVPLLGLEDGQKEPPLPVDGISVKEIEITYPEHRILEIKRIGNIVKLRDVTAKRAQDADAVESGRADAVGEMAASMAHEIGNPLNALSLNLQLLKRKYPDETDLAIAQRELERLIQIGSNRFFRNPRPVVCNSDMKDFTLSFCFQSGFILLDRCLHHRAEHTVLLLITSTELNTLHSRFGVRYVGHDGVLLYKVRMAL